MMRHVAPRSLGRIELREAAVKLPEAREPAIVPHVALMSQIDHKQFDQTVEIVFVDGHRPVHIGLAQCKVGVNQELARQRSRMKPHGNRQR